MSRIRVCDKCGLEIRYSPGKFGEAASHPIPGDPKATVQSSMSIVEIEGVEYEFCVENGCLADYSALEGTQDKDKAKQLKDWAKKPK